MEPARIQVKVCLMLTVNNGTGDYCYLQLMFDTYNTNQQTVFYLFVKNASNIKNDSTQPANFP